MIAEGILCRPARNPLDLNRRPLCEDGGFFYSPYSPVTDDKVNMGKGGRD